MFKNIDLDNFYDFKNSKTSAENLKVCAENDLSELKSKIKKINIKFKKLNEIKDYFFQISNELKKDVYPDTISKWHEYSNVANKFIKDNLLNIRDNPRTITNSIIFNKFLRSVSYYWGDLAPPKTYQFCLNDYENYLMPRTKKFLSLLCKANNVDEVCDD